MKMLKGDMRDAAFREAALPYLRTGFASENKSLPEWEFKQIDSRTMQFGSAAWKRLEEFLAIWRAKN